jgi:choloylglycine hydrolase
MMSDCNESIVIESTKEGLKIYDNPFGVLTNNPEFNYHKNNVYNYMNLSIEDPIDKTNMNLSLKPISYGQGAVGLPGDYSSQSRFIKALFVKNNMLYFDDENKVINQAFYCLDSVLMPKGLVKVGDEFEYTRYGVCYNLNKGKLYYKTYDNRNIQFIELKLLNKDLDKLIEFPL